MKNMIQTLLEDWTENDNGVRDVFVKLYELLQSLSDTELSFKARPGISYSLRAKHNAQKERELFVLVDVIDDEPDDRWLSVCLYADSLSSSLLEQGDVVPSGLMGEDACCFDAYEQEDNTVDFLISCIESAYSFAIKG